MLCSDTQNYNDDLNELQDKYIKMLKASIWPSEAKQLTACAAISPQAKPRLYAI
jgi:hypothetical protein